MIGSRANVVSSFTAIKGAMISETYAALAAWDFGITKRENIDRLRRENFIGATSATWLRDVAWVINRRFDPNGRDRALAMLARSGCPIEEWKPILLWHLTRDEFLLRDFLLHWLYAAWEEGAFRVRPEDLRPYLDDLDRRGGRTEHAWSAATRDRVAAGLLKMSVDFGLLRGTAAKEFTTYHLPDGSFLYLLHALRDQEANPAHLIASEEWRMFRMRPKDVERELLRLHQFRRLRYEVAGSLVELSLPCDTALKYAETMAA